MKSYECAMIISPEAGENASGDAKQKYTGVITSGGGEVAKIDDWGKRRLAYRIRKYEEGSYLIFYFRSNHETLAELDRQLRLDEYILRHMIVKGRQVSEVKVEPEEVESTEKAEQKEEDLG